MPSQVCSNICSPLDRCDVNFDVAVTSLARQFDMRALVLRTLLTYLELRGFIEGGTPFYSVYEVKPQMSSTELLAKLDAGRAAVCPRRARTPKESSDVVSH